MPLLPLSYPLRLPEPQLSRLYPSAEAAFNARDYLYAARYGRSNPEIHGCALLMLGNQVGGERVLDRANVRTTRSFLHRARLAWANQDHAEARRWIAEGRAMGGMDDLFDRFEALMAREKFRIVMYSDHMSEKQIQAYRHNPTLDVVGVQQMAMNSHTLLPLGHSIASVVPPGPPIDLALIQDFRVFPLGVRDLAAPVVVMAYDLEWTYDYIDELMPEVDSVSLALSGDHCELSEGFAANCAVDGHLIHYNFPDCRGMSRRFLESAGRSLDLLSTGTLTLDVFRDKRHLFPALTVLEERFNVHLLSGRLELADYWQLLKTTRFSIAMVRGANAWQTRCLEQTSQGVISLIPQEHAQQYIYSETFACFQPFTNDTIGEDITDALGRYDAIMAELTPQLPQLEAETVSLFPAYEISSTRYIRTLLFRAYVEEAGQFKAQRPNPSAPRRSVPCNTPLELMRNTAQMAAMTELTRPLDKGRPADWVRLAEARFAPLKDGVERAWILESPKIYYTAIAALEEGLGYHPTSLALRYALAVACRKIGKITEAHALFEALIAGDDSVSPDDLFPRLFDTWHGYFWIGDSRIRERASSLSPLVPERDVWISYAHSHLAGMALETALEHRGTAESLAPVADGKDEAIINALVGLVTALKACESALSLLAYNDVAQRLYLRTLYFLTLMTSDDHAAPIVTPLGKMKDWSEPFLAAFAIGRGNDLFILNDFGCQAYDIMLRKGQVEEAEAVRHDLMLSHRRLLVDRSSYTLFPEVAALLGRYDLPHGAQQDMNLRPLAEAIAYQKDKTTP